MRLAFSALLLAIAAGSTTAPAARAAGPAAGLDGSETVGVGVHRFTGANLGHLSDLGVRHVRTTLYWGLWVQDPAYRRRFADELRAAFAEGLEPLVVVHQQPSGGYAERDRVYRDFAAFVAARAAQFPRVRAWQLWNEMDVAFTEVFGAGRDDVSLRQRGRNYARMLAFAYPAIKAANPDALVVTGGIASDVEGGFLDGLYDGRARFDVLAVHTYGFPVVAAFRNRGLVARALMDGNGDDRPLWNTEFGMESAVVPPDWHATPAEIDRFHLDAWRESIQLNEREEIYDRVYGHVLEQGGDLDFDLIRDDGSPRPAYRWLRGWLRARG